MEEKKKRKTAYGVIALIIILMFIWGQSCVGTEKSSGESRFVTERIIKPVIKAIAGEEIAESVTDHFVRKLAHVTEYTALGLILGILLKKNAYRFRLCLLLGLAIAFLDETLQVFSGRGAMLTDVWIDLIGVALGGLISLLFKRKEDGGRDVCAGQKQ